MISCYHLTVPHPGRKRPLLDDICLEIESGGFVEITGPSGCGKSVLFSVLSMRRSAPGARCVIAGRNLNRLDASGLAELRRQLGSCADRPEVLGERSVLENLILPLVARGEPDTALDRAEALIDETHLANISQTPAGALSDAESRLLGIFRALVGRPELVLIDGGLRGLGQWIDQAQSALVDAHARGATVVLFDRALSRLEETRTAAWRLEDGRLQPLEGGGDDSAMMHGAA